MIQAEAGDPSSAIRQVGQAYLAAIRSGDVDAMMAQWADNPTVLPPHAPGAYGRDEVRAWAEAFQKRVRVAEASFLQSEVLVSGDLATERLTFTMTLQPTTGGPARVLTGKGVHVYSRQAGGPWQLFLDIWNTDGPDL